MTKILTAALTLTLALSAPALAAGKTVTVAYPSDFQSLDPAIGYDTQNWPVIHSLFVTLLTYDAGTKLRPWGATDLGTVSPDGKTYTFKIRKGITFANGESTDAAAFKYAFERVLNPKTKSPQGGKSGWFGGLVGADAFVDGKAKAVSGIKVIDPYTIQFVLKSPDRTFLNVLATPFASAVPKKAVEQYGADFSHHIVSNGPFLFKSWVPGQKLTLIRNPKYFDPATAAKIETLEFQLGLSEQVSLLRAQTGQVDVLGNGIPSAQFAAVNSDPKYKPYITSSVQVGTYYVFMNTQKAPFDNKLVRQAVNLAIDKKRMVQLVNGRGKVTGQILAPGLPGYDPSIPAGTQDVARAKALLKQAGYTDKGDLTFITSSDEPFPKLAQAAQQQLAAIGIKVNIKALPNAEYINTITTPGAVAIGLSNWSQDYPDPSDFLDVLFESGYYQPGGFNLSGYKNPDVDAQLAKLRGQPMDKAVAGYQKVQKQILADFAWAPLFNPVQYDFANPRVGGVAVHPVWNYVYQDWSVN
ncbi:ABC transporter substrate-binding protein [Deinococcus sp.]|uniref:ABC transporter substrate-binding protein n=1 Tax=Deinococcus sp. TaxID=47478 RepID=UPI0025ED6AC5|nr:ABC transporter substrate-binding protein [Deinococcus sp.]